MAKPAAQGSFVVVLVALLLFLALASSAAAAPAEGSGMSVGWLPSWASSGSRCHGTIGECLDDAEEDGLGIDAAARRMLGTNDYVGYNALKRDTTPCSQSGASYYNCQPGASANPYSRSCSAIANCRS